MSMMRLTRLKYNSTRPVFINLNLIAVVERCDYYTRIELANGSVVKVEEFPHIVLRDMNEWESAEIAAIDAGRAA